MTTPPIDREKLCERLERASKARQGDSFLLRAAAEIRSLLAHVRAVEAENASRETERLEDAQVVKDWRSRCRAAEARNAELEEALGPFAAMADHRDTFAKGEPDHAAFYSSTDATGCWTITEGDLRRARALAGRRTGE